MAKHVVTLTQVPKTWVGGGGGEDCTGPWNLKIWGHWSVSDLQDSEDPEGQVNGPYIHFPLSPSHTLKGEHLVLFKKLKEHGSGIFLPEILCG